MKRPIIIGTLVLLACAGAMFVDLQTQGVDRRLFMDRWPRMLAEHGFTAVGRVPLKDNEMPRPLLMKCNPRYWNEPEWAPTAGPIRLYRYSECLAVRHGEDVIECHVRHGTTVTAYAEICYEKGREATAALLSAALADSLPGLMIRLREVPALMPMAVGPQPVRSESITF